MLAHLITINARHTHVTHEGIVVTLWGNSITVPNSAILDLQAVGQDLFVYVPGAFRKSYSDFLRSLI